MRWLGGRESDNVDDRRGSGRGGLIVGGGIGTIVIALIVTLLGGDPSSILTTQNATEQAPVNQQADDAAAQFTRKVLASTEDAWTQIFAEQNSQYQKPVLVMYRGVTSSGCGTAQNAMGPFYCPADEKVYIDLSFYDELAQQFKAPGEFAMAYVIAHEIGHHVQHQMGITDKVDAMRQRLSEKEYNKLSVRLELQADFFAGVWANRAQGQSVALDEKDIESAIRAANAIGDDKIQQETQGQVVPDAFTHGTSAQRVYWFKKGLKTGDINQGDTFTSKEDANLQ
ncbi:MULTISPECIES: neutral zinc metallopeptidase [unclassified Siphonobacter]|uniref:KPN_02809 family neutral zinc metallopeptidase n=1 Tax=unclassified Siphonobacter TaxID=2635712 RepID=UPI000CC5E29E|nr:MULTISPECIES: neutral zinc metallopeptidase [unclassified Siphonobacter]MDQ1088437.1 putative metalloprotease [Siphonobacter sp. SORGH_AS_1065]MDR6194576.1 putative metalloprotease [Siphonobacter sp. SORGH_AS_0500]PKK37851.1 metalloprotease [Siphonobacter sp. SORGH_AS_0500]